MLADQGVLTTRILVINQYFYPDLASSGQLLTELCIDLAKKNDVMVVSGRPSYGGVASAPPAGIDMVQMRTAWSTSFSRHNMIGRLCNYATFLVSASYQALAMPSPDVILTMTDPPIVAAIAYIVSRIRRKPFVYICQDIFPDIALALGRLKPGPISWLLERLNVIIRRRAAAVVAIGDEMRARLISHGCDETKVVVISNWADGDAIRSGEGAGFRSRQGWDGRFVVMHSGNVGLSQDLDTLLEAAARLRDQPDVVVAIVGNGASKKHLQERVENEGIPNVVFMDYQAKEELSASLGSADIHIVSLKPGLEGLIVPSKIFGILAAGRPIIAAIGPGSQAARIVRDAGCGFQIRAGDPGALKEAILKARASDTDMMGAAGRKAFERSFDRVAAVTAYERLIAQVAETAGKPGPGTDGVG